MKYIAIDLGTSFLKGAVLDLETRALSRIARRPAPEPVPDLPAGRHELAPARVTAAVRGLLDELLDAAPDCTGILFATQMHSVVLVDDRAQPLTNIFTWQDQRALDPDPGGAGSSIDEIARRLGPDTIRQLGNELRPGQSIGALFWLAQHGQLPAGATALTMPDMILARLCGAAPGVEATNAAAFGAYDMASGAWHQPALEALGLAGLRWPPIRPVSEPAGAYSYRGRAIPCYRPVGDQQCALLGAGVAPGELSINVATGSQVSVVRADLAFGEFQTRPFFDGRWLTTITHIPAGRALNALVGLLCELAAAHGAPIDDPWPYLIDAAERAPDGELRVDLAFYPGPLGQRGAILNIREQDLNAGALLRAAFKRMAETYQICAGRLAPPVPSERLVLSGGLAQRGGPLREFIVRGFGLPYRAGPAEDTLTGLMALALAIAGRSPSASVAAASLNRQEA